MTKQDTIIARKILNNNPKRREELRSPIDTGDGYIITDGYRLIKTAENIALLEENYCSGYETFFNRILFETSKNDGECIKAPSIKNLNDSIRNFKEYHDGDKPIYQVVEGVWVNAYYLRDMLTILKGATLKFSSAPNRERKYIYIDSPKGQGILCPLTDRKAG